MPEHIRALVVVLFLSGAVFFLARPVLVQVISQEDFSRWRKLWFFTVLAWFLAHSFWIYIALMVVVLSLQRRKENHIFGLYLLLILAVPPTEMAIPGLGVFDHLFVLTHYRFLALILLLPVALQLVKSSSTPRIGSSPVDLAVLGYMTWLCLMGFRETSITNGFRISFLNVIDIFLPYYVASRSIKSHEDFRAAFAGFLLGASLLSVIAIFEVAREWRLYTAVAFELGFFNYPVSYKMRGDFLRPAGTVIDSIMVGWVIVLAMAALIYLGSRVPASNTTRLAWFTIITGVIASMSRAPWVAAILLMVIYALQTERATAYMTKFGAGLLCAAFIAAQFPAGQAIIDLLPFVGKAEQGSVQYRENLIAAAIPAIERNFFFGNPKIPDIPELQTMRQGEGIIDIVNTYIAVALYAGMIGFAFFVSMFFTAYTFLQRTKRKIVAAPHEHRVLVRALMSILLVNAFMLMTNSMFLIAPVLVYSSLGLCTACGVMFLQDRRSPSDSVFVSHLSNRV